MTAVGGRDWSEMSRADFDPGAPLVLVDAERLARPVPAVAHASGTDALFGDEPAPRRPARTRDPAPAPAIPQTDALF